MSKKKNKQDIKKYVKDKLEKYNPVVIENRMYFFCNESDFSKAQGAVASFGTTYFSQNSKNAYAKRVIYIDIENEALKDKFKNSEVICYDNIEQYKAAKLKEIAEFRIEKISNSDSSNILVSLKCQAQTSGNTKKEKMTVLENLLLVLFGESVIEICNNGIILDGSLANEVSQLIAEANQMHSNDNVSYETEGQGKEPAAAIEDTYSTKPLPQQPIVSNTGRLPVKTGKTVSCKEFFKENLYGSVVTKDTDGSYKFAVKADKFNEMNGMLVDSKSLGEGINFGIILEKDKNSNDQFNKNGINYINCVISSEHQFSKNHFERYILKPLGNQITVQDQKNTAIREVTAVQHSGKNPVWRKRLQIAAGATACTMAVGAAADGALMLSGVASMAIMLSNPAFIALVALAVAAIILPLALYATSKLPCFSEQITEERKLPATQGLQA